jgi:hypothetical protein
MPRMLWPLRHGRPCVQVALTLKLPGTSFGRTLLADTGAGCDSDDFDLILEEVDCILCGGMPFPSLNLRGAYVGTFPTYDLPIRIPALGFHQYLRAVGVPSVPAGFDGIACFRFLNRFAYGNFGDPNQFGLVG